MKKWYVMGCIRCEVKAKTKDDAEDRIAELLEIIGTSTDSGITMATIDVSDASEVER